jgi:hypothetical protein
MADDNKSIQSGLSMANANLFGVEATDPRMKAILDAQEAGLQALEQRYANPNWFNVAAGFFKPQLGGFAASVGSASQALGENVEKQRENMLPIAKMRSDIALTQLAMGQKTTAAEKAKSLLAKPGGLTAEDVAEVRNYDSARGDVLQQQLTNQQSLRKEILEARARGVEEAKLITQYGPTFTLLFPEGLPAPTPVPGAVVAKPEAKSGAGASDTPPIELNMTLTEWQNTPLLKRNDLVADLASSNKDTELASMKTYRTAAEEAQPRLELFQGMRTLATRPGMDKVFNVLGGSDVVSLGAKALSEGRLTDRLANLDNLLIQAKLTDPVLRSDAAKLVKLINESNALSSGGTSATDMAATLRNAGRPSLTNPQDAFVSLTDALAHSDKNHLDVYDLITGNGPDKTKYRAADIVSSPAYKDLKRKFMENHMTILTKPPTDVTPDWYMPTKRTAAAAPAAAPAAAAGTSRPVPTAADLDYVKKNPKTRDKFIAHFGREP